MKIEHEIIGGRISLSDMRGWLMELAKPPHNLTDEEFREFFKVHLTKRISECIGRKMLREDCEKGIFKELNLGKFVLTDSAGLFVRQVINEQYDKNQ